VAKCRSAMSHEAFRGLFWLLLLVDGTRAFQQLQAPLQHGHLLVRRLSRHSTAGLVESARPRCGPLCLSLRALSLRASGGESDADVAVTYGGVEVREWTSGDVAAIRNLLTSDDFDPEGDVSIDCSTPGALKAAYDPEESCFFLVATAAGSVVGTAALAAGTQVTTLSSGASVSRAGATGALRRAAVSIELGEEAQEAVFEALLSEVERRAVRAGCAQIIALGYGLPPATSKCRRMSSLRLAARGYEAGDELPGTEVTQLAKKLVGTGNRVAETESARPKEDGGVARAARLLVGRGSGVLILVSLALTLVGALGVASFLGLDLGVGSDDNRGVGVPLSTSEVQQLMRDEKLKRRSLDSVEDGGERGWEDLTAEERREEQALMKVISGGDVRVK
jgi:hypothetical protein